MCRQLAWFVFLSAILAPLPLMGSEPLRFVFITCCRDEAFFDPVKRGMADAARAMNVQCEFQGTEGVDLASQQAMVRKAVAAKVDGIALNIIDPDAFDTVVAEAIQRGVPVVAFNVDDVARPGRIAKTGPNPRLSAVCQDYYQAGRKVGTKALEFIPAGSRVLITQHDHGISALDDRLHGIQEVLRKRQVSWKVIVSGNDPPKALEAIAAELKANPDIHYVLGTGQTDTEAAGRAIERDFGAAGYASAGFDLSPHILRLIRAGVIRFTIDQQPYIQGYYPVVQLTLLCRYGIQPSNMDAGATIVSRADVDRVIQLKQQHYR